MNEVGKRKGPDLNFIIKDHRDDFVRHVINLYSQTKQGELVSIEDIGLGITAKFTLAGLLGHFSDEPDMFLKETEGMEEEEIEFWSIINLSSLTDHMSIGGALDLLGDDTESVLAYYNMSHIVQVGVEALSLNPVFAFRNIPIKTVW